MGVVALVGLLRVAAAGWAPPVVMPDSERYRNAADPLAPFAAWDGQGPGALVQLVNLLPLQAAIVVQTALVVGLWGAAAIYAGSLATAARSWMIFAVIYGWSLSPWFALWDGWVLTESLTLAGVALTAVGLGAIRAGRQGAPWVAVIGLAVAITARPFTGAILLPLVAIALTWPLSAARLRTMVAPIASAGVVALFAVWQVLAFGTTTNSPFSYLPEPESLTQVQATDRLAGRGHLLGYLDTARNAGMPPCPSAEAIALAPISDTDRLTQLREITDCPAFDEWLADGGLPWIREVASNPVVTIGHFVAPTPWLEGAFADYALADDRGIYLRELAGARWPLVVLAVNAAMLAATALASLAVLMLQPHRRGFFAFSLAVVAAVSFYVCATDGIEYWRHVLPAFALLTPLAVTLLGVARKPADAARVDPPGALAAGPRLLTRQH